MSERRQERKVVTVLFCDLVGFTQRSEEMDPEDVAALLGPYQARVKDELERFGGTVEKFIGDAVMALFGAPVAHEDDPERAVRAALAIRDFAHAEDVELRVGVATGEALVTIEARPDLGETMATGDVVNTAARLQSAAPVNGILVSARTYDATRQVVEYEAHERVDAKGKAEPVVVWSAVRARTGIARDRLHETPLVGRARELDLLRDAFVRTRDERQPQLVTLVGVPGIGKSRLVHELFRSVEGEDPAWRQGRCLSYGDGVTFWALGEIVKAELGINEADAAAVVEEKLLAGEPDDWVRGHLRPLVGLAADSRGAGEGRDEAFTAWRRFLEGLAAERPLTLVVEDLHWADENLLDFVDHLVDWAGGVALLVVCTSRPELLERRPTWGGGKTNALTISLSPLTDDDTGRLLASVLTSSGLSDGLRGALLARTGGNPLFAEQYARLLQERVGDELMLPETIQGIIAARLDALDPGDKAVLQDAAVVGRVFWLSAIAAISGRDPVEVEAALHGLERKGFVRRERVGSIAGDTEYAFLHVLVRDVAYGQIPRPGRAERHRLAAAWIERLGRLDDHAELLAHHYGEAVDLGRASGLDTGALEDAAKGALRDAGDRALTLSAGLRAARYYDRALGLSDHPGPERSRLLLRRAQALFYGGQQDVLAEFDEARRAFLDHGDTEGAAEAATFQAMVLWGLRRGSDALERAGYATRLLDGSESGPTKAFALANWARYLVLTDQHQEAMDAGRHALAMADELGSGELRANALNTVGLARMGSGDIDGLEDLEESLTVARAYSSPFEISRVYNNLGVSTVIAGRVDRASALFVERVAHDEHFGLPAVWGRAMRADDAYWRGDWDEHDRQVAAFFELPGSAVWWMLRSDRSRVRLARDDVTGALEDCGRALAALGDSWEIDVGTEAPCSCARTLLEVGAPEDALAVVEQVLAEAWKPPAGHAGVVELAMLLEDLGRAVDPIVDAARTWPAWPWLRAASAVARGELAAAAVQLAELRCPPLEATVLRREAKRLLGEGRREEALLALERALAFWRSVGATRYIREAEELAAALA